jgi:hypothetical protein
MAVWAWIVIIVAAVLVVGAAAWALGSRRRTQHLKNRFGPEYDRAAREAGGRREAESELAAREQRREKLNIRPLSEPARDRYASRWEEVQTRFVDAPEEAVEQADKLVNQVMSERGYPMDDFDQRAADISVDYPVVVENYREAHRVYVSVKQGGATTEEERWAMRHYRSLFEELLDSAGNGARSTERTATNG